MGGGDQIVKASANKTLFTTFSIAVGTQDCRDAVCPQRFGSADPGPCSQGIVYRIVHKIRCPIAVSFQKQRKTLYIGAYSAIGLNKVIVCVH